MKKRIFSVILTIVMMFLWIGSCDLPHRPGPMPEDIIDTEFEPGLNVFGILRADNSPGTSFIHVERAVTTEEMYENEEIFITSAFVQISDTITSQMTIFSPSPDTIEKGYYFNSTFSPQPGHHYELEIAADDLPVLKGETTVPVKPAIVPQSLSITDQKVRFDLVLTTDTYQYNIYLFFGDNYLEKQLPNYQTGSKKVEFNIADKSSLPTGIVIIGYDKNLTEYLNSSPSFLPQTFHETVRTVEDGYGCFGSLSVTLIPL